MGNGASVEGVYAAVAAISEKQIPAVTFPFAK
jgi:hypothetical protein